MKKYRFTTSTWLLVGLLLIPAAGRATPKKSKQPREKEPEVVRQLVDRIIVRENEMMKVLPKYSPRVETYLQNYRPDPDLGVVAVSDKYYFGRLAYDQRIESRSFLPEHRYGFLPRFLVKAVKRPFVFNYDLDSFVQATLVDPRGLDRAHYRFRFVRREFLGDVRCLIFDVIPEGKSRTGTFKGRIWVEDQDLTIVRFKGVRENPPKFYIYFHFDSWRQNLQPGLWLPVGIYVEETNLDTPSILGLASEPTMFRGQTRFWGYDLSNLVREEELTRILVEAPLPVRDDVRTGEDLSPLASQREWESEAENNVLERLEKARILAPPGEFEKVLDTVVNNLIVTNHLDNLPAVRCRVMLTLPFESFTIGRTIVVSRGLIDVLPDEASLAAMLAHELAHLALGHTSSTEYAFSDRLLISDEELVEKLDFGRDAQTEGEADAKALELLKHSPYKESLEKAGLFLRALAQSAPNLRQLFGAHLGTRMASGRHMFRLERLRNSAPELEPLRLDQLAAFPLGSRLRVDSWNGQVEMMKAQPVAPLSAREKMPFLVTPMFPHLTRKGTTAVGALARPRPAEDRAQLP
jgi:hypothetical protein